MACAVRYTISPRAPVTNRKKHSDSRINAEPAIGNDTVPSTAKRYTVQSVINIDIVSTGNASVANHRSGRSENDEMIFIVQRSSNTLYTRDKPYLD